LLAGLGLRVAVPSNKRLKLTARVD
jgi:hypothetical protein